MNEEGITPTRRTHARLEAAGLDGFGENGELHTLACVWDAPPAQALGLDESAWQC